MPHVNFDFQIKKATKSEVIIEGLANANTIDRIKERILPDAWDLENYKKNPVVLFDHGHDPAFGHMPIGKALEVRATPDGLFTRIQISGSKSEKISAIRDLVEEGILKTFSVGFEPKQSQKAEDDPDVNLITRAELLETSIVPIPMNQDSTFSMLRKRKAYWKTPLARKWYDKFCEQVRLVKKSAWVAAAVHRRMSELIDAGQIRNPDAAVRYIADEAGQPMTVIRSIIDGSEKSVDDRTIKAFAAVLRMDGELLMNLRNGSFEVFEALMAKSAKSTEGQEMTTDNTTTTEPVNEEEGKGCGKPSKEDEEGKKAMPEITSCIHAILAPKETYATVEEAADVASAAGFNTDPSIVSETDDAWVFTQTPADQCDVEAAQPLDVGNGMIALVAPKIAAPEEQPSVEPTQETQPVEGQTEQMPADQLSTDAPAAKAEDSTDEQTEPEDDPKVEVEVEVEVESESENTDEEFTQEELAAAVDQFNADQSSEAKPQWATDEERWAKASRMAASAEVDDPKAFAQWLYLNQKDEGEKLAHPSEQKSVGGGDENPYLELGRQQNVLLGALIKEVQVMSSKLNGLPDVMLAKVQEQSTDGETTSNTDGQTETAPPATDESGDGKDDEDTKSLDMIREYQRNLHRRLKSLNV